ncbi:MAG: Transcriptional regulatory protein terminal [Actinomycetota bacterium]|jgi:DNA-binding response OmpR family regulator
MPETSTEAAPTQGLTTLDMGTLRLLVEHQGRVIGRDQMARMLNVETSAARRVDGSLVVLRRLLGPDAIKTVRSRGWMLTAIGLSSAYKLLQLQIDTVG